MTKILYPDVAITSLGDALQIDGTFGFSPGTIQGLLADGQHLIMGVQVDAGTDWINPNPNGGGSHFVSVTNVWYENDHWMIEWYDPWINAPKVASFDDFAAAAYEFNHLDRYSGFFVH